MVAWVAFAAITICVIAASFFGSASFASFVSQFTLSKHQHQRQLFGLLVGLVFALCMAIQFESLRSGVVTAWITLWAQLGVAALLGMGLPKKHA
jgi:hypothetical protein